MDLASSAQETKHDWSARMVGSVLGGAFAVTIFVLLAFRSQRFADLTDFSLNTVGLAILVVLIAMGAIAGRRMAAAHLVPPLRPLYTIALAGIFAFGPFSAGVVQVALREPALPVPEDVQSLEWVRKPWGEILLVFESATEVEILHE